MGSSLLVSFSDSSFLIRVLLFVPVSAFRFLDHRTGEQVCTACGLVVGNQLISEQCEWRTFESDGDECRIVSLRCGTCFSGHTGHGQDVDPNRIGGPEKAVFAPFGLSTIVAGDPKLGRHQPRDKVLQCIGCSVYSLFLSIRAPPRLQSFRPVLAKYKVRFVLFLDFNFSCWLEFGARLSLNDRVLVSDCFLGF